MRPPLAHDGLVACLGRNVSELCAKALPRIAAGCPDLNLQFVMTDWLAEEQIRRATVYWVLDAAAGHQDIRIALRYGIPLLVPEQSAVLKQAIVEGNCGLFYQNLEEAVACLIYLVRNPDIAETMAKNARLSFHADLPFHASSIDAGR